MKSLAEHNAEMRKREKASKFLKAGVSCDGCGSEMEFLEPEPFVLLSWPPERRVYCPSCNMRGFFLTKRTHLTKEKVKILQDFTDLFNTESA